MQPCALLFSFLLLIFAHHSHCRPANSDESYSGGALAAQAINLTSSDNNGLPSEVSSSSTTNPPPSTYRLGTRPGGLRLITEQDKNVRIIFLFDFTPVHLFRRQYLKNKNSIRNIITKDDA